MQNGKDAKRPAPTDQQDAITHFLPLTSKMGPAPCYLYSHFSIVTIPLPLNPPPLVTSVAQKNSQY
jgi:hypothetical protein